MALTHSPSLIKPDTEMDFSITRSLRNPNLPAELKIPTNWPEAMRIEYGEDEGLGAAQRARERLVHGFRQLRAAIDAFQPDFVLIWGDDQYENFKEDIIPPFCVLAYGEMACQPFRMKDGQTRVNVWDEPAGQTFQYAGHPQAARSLTRGLLEQGIDMAYAYKPLHEKGGLGHAILNTLLYLDYDRQGFDYPVVPFLVNCYGSKVIRNRGGAVQYEAEFDPPGPSPRRCMEVGAAVARTLHASPWRVALVASSSWSHAFLTEKHHCLYPDVAADRARFEELREGDYAAWSRLSTEQIEDAGQQELLNWMCLAGAMQELDYRPEIIDYVETYIFNSNKCVALFKP